MQQAFTPTAGQWRAELVDLAAYEGDPSVIIAFENVNGYGNNLYIDNIDVDGRRRRHPTSMATATPPRRTTATTTTRP